VQVVALISPKVIVVCLSSGWSGYFILWVQPQREFAGIRFTNFVIWHFTDFNVAHSPQ